MPHSSKQKRKEWHKRWRDENREYLREYDRQWREDNKEKVRKSARDWYNRNKKSSVNNLTKLAEYVIINSSHNGDSHD